MAPGCLFRNMKNAIFTFLFCPYLLVFGRHIGSNINSTTEATAESNRVCVSPPLSIPAEWIVHGGFVPIIIGMIVMFWGLTIICEEYCVPAISIICQRYRISDDFAGSTVIGAGLSLPVLFASYIGLFSLNASVGLGTVVGGNLFNQTINIAGSVFVAPNRRLKLCKVVLTREMISYGISNFIILWVVQQNLEDSFLRTFKPNEVFRCVSVPWQKSLILICCYIGYCFMEGYFLTTVRLYLRWRRLGTIYGNDFLPKSSKLAIASENPRRSPSSVLPLSNGAYNNSNFVGDESAPHAKSDENLQDDDARIPVVHANDDDFELATVFDEGGVEGSEKLEQGQFAQDTIDFSDFVLLEMSESLFPRVLTEVTWKKRFCTIHDEGFLSYRLRKEQLTGGRHQRFVDLSADEGIKILNADIFEFSIGARHPCCRTFKFRANDKATFSSVTIRLLEVSVQYKRLSVEERRSKALAAMDGITYFEGFEWGSTLTPNSFGRTVLSEEAVGDKVFVVPVSRPGRAFYYLVHPIRLMIYYTTPDVKLNGAKHRATLCIVMCIFWMAAESYAIMLGLIELGNLIQMDPAVVGLTVAAWAASYPALWSSFVVAKDGQGDVVTGNAFGSNVFSNYIGLGLPWLTFSLIYNNEVYDGIQDGGIVLCIVLLTSLAILFYAMVAFNNFELNMWIAWSLCAQYVACGVYLCYNLSGV